MILTAQIYNLKNTTDLIIYEFYLFQGINESNWCFCGAVSILPAVRTVSGVADDGLRISSGSLASSISGADIKFLDKHQHECFIFCGKKDRHYSFNQLFIVFFYFSAGFVL